MNRTGIDWWAWRSHAKPAQQAAALAAAFNRDVQLRPRARGFLGYDESAQIVVGDLDVGVCAWGGDNQKGWSYTSISGQGCQWIDDWDRAQQAADGCPGYELKRVDLALDTFDGSSSFDATLAAYRAGAFCPPGTRGGRPPKCEPMKPERYEDSAIIRIGSRSGNKYLRGYEKGKQLLGPLITAAMQRDPEEFDWGAWVTHCQPVAVGGEVRAVQVWDWWRLELELKPSSAELPEDVIDRRDQYFAGAYPYLGQVLKGVESEALVMRRERGPQLDLALALENVRQHYGSTLFTALVAYHGDIGAVWDRIVGKKLSQRLVSAGVLMVEHD